MTKRIEKRDLPSKICPVCGRPFTWRRKWGANWDEVRYCSERCRRATKAATSETTRLP